MSTRVEQIKESYWKDFKELNTHGPKLSHATARLLKAETAPFVLASHLPPRTTTTLAGVRGVDVVREKLLGRVSLMGVAYVRYGEEHVRSFVDAFRDAFPTSHAGKGDGPQVVELNVQENYLKRAVLYLSVPYIRRHVPSPHHDNYILCYTDTYALRRHIGISNMYLGWVFLVDHEARVRWRAHGVATEEELSTMVKLARVLEARRLTLQQTKDAMERSIS